MDRGASRGERRTGVPWALSNRGYARLQASRPTRTTHLPGRCGVVELRVRPMGVEDLDVRLRYFREATGEHLELIGVDRSPCVPPLSRDDSWRVALRSVGMGMALSLAPRSGSPAPRIGSGAAGGWAGIRPRRTFATQPARLTQ